MSVRSSRVDGWRRMSRRVLVIGAHAADFVWRAGGAIAVATRAGGTAQVIALSYGERGESGELWKQEGQTVENVKRIRHAEAEKAAARARRRVPRARLRRLPARRRRRSAWRRSSTRSASSRPTCSSPTPTPTRSTRTTRSPTTSSSARARSPPAPACASAFDSIRPPDLFLFEPHQPELCNFTPTTFVDITRGLRAKREAMAAMEAQKYLQTYYAQRAEQRGNHARRASGDQDVRYAEAFQRVIPQVVAEL